MDEFNTKNKERWDYLAKAHFHSEYYGLEEFRKGTSSLYGIEKDELPDVSGKSILHLQCHFGMDSLSLARMGAKVTGVDYSEVAIELAQELSNDLDIPATFISSDIYKLEEKLDETFDMVYTSYGVLCWLPDLTKWAQLIAKYLKPGGIFYIVENHPFREVFDNEDETLDWDLRYKYFSDPKPTKWEVEGSYANEDKSVTFTAYEWSHTLSSIINALIKAGLQIEFLNEHDIATWKMFTFMEKTEDNMYKLDSSVKGNIPLTFSLQAKKPE